ncbi:hypothetical protein BJV74DRAFT_987988 [Russula compacta]|nr:hypothetical protein BJV74DRAFT_987988 [Russula compacta]
MLQDRVNQVVGYAEDKRRGVDARVQLRSRVVGGWTLPGANGSDSIPSRCGTSTRPTEAQNRGSAGHHGVSIPWADGSLVSPGIGALPALSSSWPMRVAGPGVIIHPSPLPRGWRIEHSLEDDPWHLDILSGSNQIPQIVSFDRGPSEGYIEDSITASDLDQLPTI